MNTVAREHPSKQSPRPIAATNILHLLKSRDLSAAELAKYLEVHRSYMSRMLNGENPLDPYMAKISEFLAVPVAQLERTGSPVALEESSMLPWGALDKDGRCEVPSGCILKRIDKKLDAPKDVGRYVLLGPIKQKPKTSDLVYCALMNGDVFMRYFTQNAGDPNIFMLQPNAARDPVVAVHLPSVNELRVVAIKNLF